MTDKPLSANWTGAELWAHGLGTQVVCGERIVGERISDGVEITSVADAVEVIWDDLRALAQAILDGARNEHPVIEEQGWYPVFDTATHTVTVVPANMFDPGGSARDSVLLVSMVCTFRFEREAR